MKRGIPGCATLTINPAVVAPVPTGQDLALEGIATLLRRIRRTRIERQIKPLLAVFHRHLVNDVWELGVPFGYGWIPSGSMNGMVGTTDMPSCEDSEVEDDGENEVPMTYSCVILPGGSLISHDDMENPEETSDIKDFLLEQMAEDLVESHIIVFMMFAIGRNTLDKMWAIARITVDGTDDIQKSEQFAKFIFERN